MREKERETRRRGAHVVSVVRHERKFERGSPWWRPGNRKRPNARHEAPASDKGRRKAAARKKEQTGKRGYTLKADEHVHEQRERAIWSRGRRETGEKERVLRRPAC